MTEYEISQEIVEEVLQEVKKEKAQGIKFITLLIDEMSDLAEESVQLYFDVLSEGTPAEGAQLTFRKANLTEAGECFFIESIEFI